MAEPGGKVRPLEKLSQAQVCLLTGPEAQEACSHPVELMYNAGGVMHDVPGRRFFKELGEMRVTLPRPGQPGGLLLRFAAQVGD